MIFIVLLLSKMAELLQDYKMAWSPRKRVENTDNDKKVIMLRLPLSLKESVDKQAIVENKSVNLLLTEIIQGYIKNYEPSKPAIN